MQSQLWPELLYPIGALVVLLNVIWHLKQNPILFGTGFLIRLLRRRRKRGLPGRR